MARLPIPSQLAPDELPANMTVSSTDCEQWYDEQCAEQADDDGTAAYLAMQRTVRAALDEEKRQEAGGPAEGLAEADGGADGEADGLRARLPVSFGRAAADPVRERIAAIHASIYGA